MLIEVSLPERPTEVFTATDRFNAIQQYESIHGLNDTNFDYRISQVLEGSTPVSPSPEKLESVAEEIETTTTEENTDGRSKTTDD